VQRHCHVSPFARPSLTAVTLPWIALRGHPNDDVRLMMAHKGKSALQILGSPDDLKFRSCLTLFGRAASDSSDRMLFAQALDQFYGGEGDPRTLELLRST